MKSEEKKNPYVHVHYSSSICNLKMCKTWCMRHRSVFECYTRYDIIELITIQLANSICVGLLASECMFVCVWGTKNPSCMCNKAAASTSVCSVHFAHFWNMRIKHKSGGRGCMSSEARPFVVIITITHRAQTAFNGSCKTQKHAQRCGHSTSQRAKHCPDATV